MFSKSKKESREQTEQREQFEYARRRMKQKKGVLQHFTYYLVGSIIILIVNPVLGYGDQFFIKDWYFWVLLIWGAFFLLHVFNVFIMNKFMDKEWEDKQLERLKAKQEDRIKELENQIENETPKLSDLKKKDPHLPKDL